MDIAVANLRALLDRVEKARGPDRNIDADLDLLCRSVEPTGSKETGEQFTTSEEVALAFVQLMLPGWRAALFGRNFSGEYQGVVRRDEDSYIGRGGTPALAIIAATLRALQVRSEF
jgi:hypothetical protein